MTQNPEAERERTDKTDEKILKKKILHVKSIRKIVKRTNDKLGKTHATYITKSKYP